ncbi:MAG: endonuclease/exonuclease/phosphatase family protein [Candidatus Hydrogenedentes bacterium]|nr:endonuclease/exonuclease/phosphatase family protein [Candidatus Hydrogenedentota bacterium]
MSEEGLPADYKSESDAVNSPSRRWPASVLSRFCWWSQVAVVGVAMATFTGYLAPFYYRFELATHFVAFYFGVALIATVTLTAARRWGWAAIAGLLLLVNGAPAMMCYVPASASAAVARARLTVVTANVHTENTNHRSLVEYILRTKPDILALQEVNAAWLRDLAPLRALYPYRIERPRDDNFGIALFSQAPLKDTNTVYLADAEVPAIVASIAVGSAQVQLLCLHTLPPVTEEYARVRNAMLRAAGEQVDRRQGPLVVLGDFNTSMWSPFYKQLIKESGLRNARQGFGILPTWPAGLSPFMIPLDHCLVSKEFAVSRCVVGPDIQSDHRPLQSELVIRE